ncbi:MAG: ferritin-like domain-containing protein [Kiloniellales bacterium]|nr:ferritin-like domain-containing protein [Kiloniellales bacterium]
MSRTRAIRDWTLDDIPWHHFDAQKVDPDILKLVKAASLVEYNGGDYATYLCNVFNDDHEFQAAARAWANEEVRHGRALGRWAEMADESFDFEGSFQEFLAGFRLPLEATSSVRGSRSGELVARCMVEIGTSSYYTALAEATEEPVLRAICSNIAGDEFRHYKLFYSYLNRYLEREGLGRLRRALVALGRVRESEDDELAYAYYAANGNGETYDRRRYSDAYFQRACSYYRARHIRRMVAMSFMAAGLSPRGRLAEWACRFLSWRLRLRHQMADQTA